MAQGQKLKFHKKKENKPQQRKNVPVEPIEREKQEVVKTMKKTINNAQKKIYRNIESAIIAKAKQKRTNFELL